MTGLDEINDMKSVGYKSLSKPKHPDGSPFFTKGGVANSLNPKADTFFNVSNTNRKSIQKAPLNTPKINQLRDLLKGDKEANAINLMRTLSSEEKDAVLASKEFQGLAVKAFGDDEMLNAMMAMNRNLYQSLVWMFDEGTNWDKAKRIIGRISASVGKAMVRSDNWMKKKFVKICNDEEMAEAMDLLGGSLKEKLMWMKAEGSNWGLVKEKLVATKKVAPGQLTALYTDDNIRSFFTSVCNDEEMAEAVKIMGGALFQQLWWMAIEESNWGLVREKIKAEPNPKQRTKVYEYNFLRKFFVEVVNDEQMAEAVKLLGGKLLQKLRWMNAEDSNWKLVKQTITDTKNAAEKVSLYNYVDMQSFFVKVCNDVTMAEAVDLLDGNLKQQLTWMNAEDSNWSLVKAKLLKAKKTDPGQLAALYTDNGMRSFFIAVCNDNQMAEAVGIMGGDLIQQLWWMAKEESNWGLVKEKIIAQPNVAQRKRLYQFPFMREFFVEVCNDPNMTEAVKLLGGTLPQKLDWLLAEEASAKYFFEIIQEADTGQLKSVGRSLRVRIKDELSNADYRHVIEMLDLGLLRRGEVDKELEEKLFTPDSSTPPTWKLKTYGGDTGYNIELRRDQLRITVRIKLTGAATTPAIRARWIRGIHNRWTNKFHIEGPRRLRIVFSPIFTQSNTHHSVKVHNDPTGSIPVDAGNWRLASGGDTIAHEFGHLVGNEDEYQRTAADFQRVVGRAATAAEAQPSGGFSNAADMIMRTGRGDAQIRHFREFINWLNKNRLPGESHYRLVAGP